MSIIIDVKRSLCQTSIRQLISVEHHVIQNMINITKKQHVFYHQKYENLSFVSRIKSCPWLHAHDQNVRSTLLLTEDMDFFSFFCGCNYHHNQISQLKRDKTTLILWT